MVHPPARTMAVTLLVPILAAGRRVLAIFRSIFILCLDAMRGAFWRGLRLFAPSSSSSPSGRPATTTDSVASSSSSSSSPSSSSYYPSTSVLIISKNPPEQTDHLQPSTSSTSPTGDKPSQDDAEAIVAHTHDPARSREEGQGVRSAADRSTMVTAPSPPASSSAAPAKAALPKKVPVPNVIPALPRLPLLRKRENVTTLGPTLISTATAVTATNDAQLSNGVARLRLDGGAVMPQADSVPKMVEVTEGDEKEASQIAGGGLFRAATQQILVDVGVNDSSAKREVVRAPPVPMTHEFSQTSKLKETATTIRVGKDTVQIKRALAETPEQAAERAIHSGFMRAALDMVSFLVLSVPRVSRFCRERDGCYLLGYFVSVVSLTIRHRLD